MGDHCIVVLYCKAYATATLIQRGGIFQIKSRSSIIIKNPFDFRHDSESIQFVQSTLCWTCHVILDEFASTHNESEPTSAPIMLEHSFILPFPIDPLSQSCDCLPCHWRQYSFISIATINFRHRKGLRYLRKFVNLHTIFSFLFLVKVFIVGAP